MLFPQNMGESLCIDELSLSKGELYTFVTNKNGKGKKGSLVAAIKGTQSTTIIEVLEQMSLTSRKNVREVSLDMAKNMESAVRMSFPEAKLVTDRFHFIKLVIDALQHVRIKLRWEAIDTENDEIEEAKKKKQKYSPMEFSNGDTAKQLLARSRYLLAKNQNKWTENQKERSQILFDQHPKLQTAYNHTMWFRNIFEKVSKSEAKMELEKWLNETKEINIKEFNTASNSIKNNMENILNFFDNRTTNAFAESFNAKTKLFRANQRGVKDQTFFLFRLMNLFA